ncbi:MAG: CpaD family pilus assembly lipoprotein [Alphaproteobacteria bacterium]
MKKRRMFVRKRTHRVRFFLLAAAAAILAACGPATTQWSPSESPKRNKVQWVHFTHPVYFAPGAARLETAEAGRLDAFLDRISAGTGDQIRLSSLADPGLGETQAARRAGVVATYLRDRGLMSRSATAPAQPAGDLKKRDIVTVALGRYVVTPPDCPDWRKPASEDYANKVASNFGCASVTNLGLMLADPGDLVRGRSMGPGDGDALARGVRKYREGEPTPAPTITPLVIQSGVGGGGAQ